MPNVLPLRGQTVVANGDGTASFQSAPGDSLAMQQASWWIDPVGGDDRNDGASRTTPIRTFAALLKRYGSFSPILSVRVTVTWLNSAPATDPIVFAPFLVGGGGVVLQGTLSQVGTATIGTYAPQNPATGSLNTITAQGQSGAFWTTFVGCTVHDSTAGAQFHVIADLGSGTAQITAPKAYPVSGFGTDVTIANGDALLIFRPLTVSATYLDSVAFGDVSGQGCQVSQLTLTGDFFAVVGSQWAFAECNVVSVTIQTRHTYEGSSGPTFTSCFLQSGGGGSLVPFSGRGGFFGGALLTQGNNFMDGATLDGDVVIPLRIHTAGHIKLGRVYLGQTPTIDNPPTVYEIIAQNSGAPRVWGPAGLTVINGSYVLFTGVTATASMLLTGVLSLGTTTGYPWVAASHAFGAGVPITAAAIDANGGLRNPATGSGYVFP